MGKIDRIQLRGISRTPSDRMTADGGCAESLNLYIDNDESAPAIMPDDVTGKLGLPDDLQADRVFLHKTASYENYVVQQGSVISAYTAKGQKAVVTLSKGEQLKDINSIGNIVIIVTSETVYYSLWKNEEYKYIGDTIPVPSIRFEVLGNDDETFYAKNSGVVRVDTSGQVDGAQAIAAFSKSAWEEAARGIADSEELLAYFAKLQKDLWDAVQATKDKIGNWGYFSCPRLVRYAIKLYDGSYVYHSAPVLLGAGDKTWISVTGGYTDTINYSSLSYRINLFYKAVAKLVSWDVEDWTDIITGVDIFITDDITYPQINAEFASCDEGGGNIYFRGYEDEFGAVRDEVLSKGNFYKIVSVSAGDLSELRKGIDLHKDNKVEKSEDLMVMERLTSDYMTSHRVIPSDTMVYNNRLLINANKIELPAPYTHFCSQFCDASKAYNEHDAVQHQQEKRYRFKFFIRRNNGKEYTVVARNPEGSMEFVTPFVTNGAPSKLETTFYADPMAWISYPDPNCYKVQIDFCDGDVATVEMHSHPLLSCAYAFIGVGGYFQDQQVAGDTAITEEEKKTYSVNNQVMLSEINNPFIFLAGKRYTLQSKVLGTALATTALSQGQFGQFPLYVFTEDGIWAMETASDGSFITSKPLSRDVCVNPESITPIDSAVVFVTDKGVMLLQGSQVLNISPNMNGRHYTIESTVETIIEGQEFFRDLIPVLTDSTHFLAFVRNAKIAYDYPGKRLIFLKEDEKYQYIYKLDTDTWHKTAYGIDLLAPVNSYPECLVQAKKASARTYIRLLENNSQEEWDYLADRIRVVLPDARDEEIDAFLEGDARLDVTALSEDDQEWLFNELDYYNLVLSWEEGERISTRIYDLSTILDAVETKTPMRGVIATRPFDLQAPDVLKTITDIQVRGQYAKGAVKFMLLGSMDGIHYYVIGTKRGKSWKLFRLVILADLEPTERVSWVDIEYETKFTNRLR